jgi:hypothetical protein
MLSKQKKERNISPVRLSRAALFFFAGAAILLDAHSQDERAGHIIQSCDALPGQLEACYGNCYDGMLVYDTDSNVFANDIFLVECWCPGDPIEKRNHIWLRHRRRR